MADNKVTFGLEKVYVAFASPTGTQPAWETPTPVPGAVGLTPSAVGGQSSFYADNILYFTANSNNGYTADLEVALIPDTILAKMLGWSVDTNSALVEVADGTPTKFALLGQVLGDAKNRRFVYWDCQASRPNKERTTKTDTTTPSTDKISITISPIEISGKKVVQGQIELGTTNATAYNGWFSGVYKPTFV